MARPDPITSRTERLDSPDPRLQLARPDHDVVPDRHLTPGQGAGHHGAGSFGGKYPINPKPSSGSIDGSRRVGHHLVQRHP